MNVISNIMNLTKIVSRSFNLRSYISCQAAARRLRLHKLNNINCFLRMINSNRCHLSLFKNKNVSEMMKAYGHKETVQYRVFKMKKKDENDKNDKNDENDENVTCLKNVNSSFDDILNATLAGDSLSLPLIDRKNDGVSCSKDEINGNWKFSILDNSLRIASCDRGQLLTSLGLCVNVGSRLKTRRLGLLQTLESQSFKGSHCAPHPTSIQQMQRIGNDWMSALSREHLTYFVDGLRRNLDELLAPLLGNVICPDYSLMDTGKMGHLHDELMSRWDQLMMEVMHHTAWLGRGLGKPLIIDPTTVKTFDKNDLIKFTESYLGPENCVLVGLDINHDELCNAALTLSAKYKWDSKSRAARPRPYLEFYTGGQSLLPARGSDFVMLSLAHKMPTGWLTKESVTGGVLQALLGGGGSFSTGGPGKGIKSRLYENVLMTCPFVDSINAFHIPYTDTGLFGIQANVAPDKADLMFHIIYDQFYGVIDKVSEVEMMRCKNFLKSQLAMGLENRHVLLDEYGKELALSNYFLSVEEVFKAIDGVTSEDLSSLVKRLMRSGPTVVAIGDVSYVPKHRRINALRKKMR